MHARRNTLIRRIIITSILLKVAHLLFVLLLDFIVADYDTSAEILPLESLQSHNVLQQLVVWDAVFYQDIGSRGYLYEQYYAFFSLFPALANLWGAAMFAPLALLINLFCSTVSAVWLFWLGESVTRDPELSLVATMFFLINPAAVFYAMPYTEALFTAATWTGLVALYCQSASLLVKSSKKEADLAAAAFTLGQPAPLTHVRLWLAAAAFAVAAGTRSNGIINAGFLMHAAAKSALHALGKRQYLPAAMTLLEGCAASVAITIPLLAHQYRGWHDLCEPGRALLHSTNLPRRPWCGPEGGQWWQSSAVYSFIQKEYWDLGAFKYWRVDQIPNFLLAGPVLVISIAGCVAYARARPRHLFTGGLFARKERAPAAAASPSVRLSTQNASESEEPPTSSSTSGNCHPSTMTHRQPGSSSRKQAISNGSKPVKNEQCTTLTPNLGVNQVSGFFSPDVAVFILPWAFMIAVAVVVMHVQVSTRFLSSCPVLYWYMAHVWRRGSAPLRYAVWLFCFAYAALGTLLHVNFYPWT